MLDWTKGNRLHFLEWKRHVKLICTQHRLRWRCWNDGWGLSSAKVPYNFKVNCSQLATLHSRDRDDDGDAWGWEYMWCNCRLKGSLMNPRLQRLLRWGEVLRRNWTVHVAIDQKTRFFKSGWSIESFYAGCSRSFSPYPIVNGEKAQAQR